MTIENQQDGADSTRSKAEQIVTPEKFAASRRRFAKASLAASGVILSVVSQPGMACSVCTSPSGSLSGGLQSHHGAAPVCSGKPPSYWAGCSSWPSGCQGTTLFRTVFHVPNSRSKYYPPTFKEVCTPQDFNDQTGLGGCLAAAYLNAAAGLTSYLTTTQVQSIFQEWQSTGYYTPSAGVKWDVTQIVAYLEGTQN